MFVDDQVPIMSLAPKKVIITSWFSYLFSSMHLREIALRTRILMPQIRSIKKLCVPHKENKGDGGFPRTHVSLIE